MSLEITPELTDKLLRLKNSCSYILPIDEETRQKEIKKAKESKKVDIRALQQSLAEESKKDVLQDKKQDLQHSKILVDKTKTKSEKINQQVQEKSKDSLNIINKNKNIIEDDIEDEDFDEIKTNFKKNNEQKPIKNNAEIKVVQTQKHESVKKDEKILHKKEIELSLNNSNKTILPTKTKKPIVVKQKETSDNAKNKTVKINQISKDKNADKLSLSEKKKMIVVKDSLTGSNKNIAKSSLTPKKAQTLKPIDKPIQQSTSVQKNAKMKNSKKLKFDANKLEMAKQKSRAQRGIGGIKSVDVPKDYKGDQNFMKDIFKFEDIPATDYFAEEERAEGFTVNKDALKQSKTVQKKKKSEIPQKNIKITPLRDQKTKELFYPTMKDNYNLKDEAIEKKRDKMLRKKQIASDESSYALFKQEEAEKKVKQQMLSNRKNMLNFKPKKNK